MTEPTTNNHAARDAGQDWWSAKQAPRRPDFHVSNHGTIFLVTALNDTAEDHLSVNVQEDAQYYGDALVVEHRYIADLVQALQQEGFIVS